MSAVFSAPISSAGFQLCQLSVCVWILYSQCVVSARRRARQRSVWVTGYSLALLYGFRCRGGMQGCHAKLIKCSHLGSSRAATQCPRLNRPQPALKAFCGASESTAAAGSRPGKCFYWSILSFPTGAPALTARCIYIHIKMVQMLYGQRTGEQNTTHRAPRWNDDIIDGWNGRVRLSWTSADRNITTDNPPSGSW